MSDQEPFIFLAFGMFLILLGLIQTYFGKTWLRGRGWIYRAKQPIRYWSTVAMCFLCGVLSIAVFLWETHALSH
jgi:H+/Cl- antiporter ClcA